MSHNQSSGGGYAPDEAEGAGTGQVVTGSQAAYLTDDELRAMELSGELAGLSVNALAFLMTKLRPDWQAPGCVAALRKVNLPLGPLMIAAARYATDPANLTPAHIADLSNRAWDTDWHLPCPTHGNDAKRHVSGECAACRADRLEARDEPQRQPSPPPAPLRQLVTGYTPPVVERDAAAVARYHEGMQQARAELEELRSHGEAS